MYRIRGSGTKSSMFSRSNFLYIVSNKKPHDFKDLQYVNFPKLQNLKISYRCFEAEHVAKFLENNGKHLKELYTVKSRCTELAVQE